MRHRARFETNQLSPATVDDDRSCRFTHCGFLRMEASRSDWPAAGRDSQSGTVSRKIEGQFDTAVYCIRNAHRQRPGTTHPEIEFAFKLTARCLNQVGRRPHGRHRTH